MPYQTEEQRQRTFRDAGLTSTEQAAVTAGVGTINSSLFNPTPTIKYKQPEPQANYPVATLATSQPSTSQPADPYALTPEQKEASDLNKRMRELSDTLLGETDYRTALEKQAGVSYTTSADGTRNFVDKDLTDFDAQLNQLKNENLALQTYDPARDPALGGRGITKSGLHPYSREHAERIRVNAVNALGVATLIEAKRGRLNYALQLVDRAVEEKFGRKRKELEATKANLENALKDPAYTVAEKKQAAAILAAQKAEENKLAREEEDFKTIQGLVLQASQNEAPAAILDNMKRATSPLEASIAGRGYLQKETATSIQEYQFAVRNGYEGSFTDYQNEDANRKIAIAAAGTNGLSTQQTQNFLRITDKFQADGVINTGQKAVSAVEIADRVIANPNSAGSQLSILYTLVKNLDADSAVREGELALAQQTQSYFGRFQNSFTRIEKGQIISPDAAVQLANETKELAKAWKAAATRREKQYKSQAQIAGIGDAFNQYISGADLTYKPTLDDFYRDNPDQRPAVEQLIQDNPALSDDEILQILYEGPPSFNPVGGDTNTSLNRPTRNNNPLNIKKSNFTMKFPGVTGIDKKPAADGGYFLTFDSPQDGFNAAKKLIQSSGYINLTVDKALRRWSNNGYGGELIPSIKNKTVKQLSPAELDALIKAMAKREGYNA